jgi:hypothetical protein
MYAPDAVEWRMALRFLAPQRMTRLADFVAKVGDGKGEATASMS